MFSLRWARWFVLGAAFAALVPGGAVAQTVPVSGVVRAAGTGEGLEGVLLTEVGTGRTVTTDREGRFRLEVLAGTLSLRLSRLGYSEKGVNEPTGTNGLALDILMTRRAIDLGEIVTTVSGERRRVELGNTVGKIEAAPIVAQSAVPSMSALIQSRIPGVMVQGSAGLVGTGSRIRIRGSNSLLLRNDPIVYIDGIRAESRTAGRTVFPVGSRLSQSRFDDLNPEDIESIEVVRGPSAAALYGTEAANGVIRITTRRGRPGPARFDLNVEQGVVRKGVTFEPNYGALDENGQSCWLVDAHAGQCNQVTFVTENPLEDEATSPFSDAWRRQYRLSVSGGNETSRYFVSGEWEVEDGILELAEAAVDTLAATRTLPNEFIRPNSSRRGSFRANFDQTLGEAAELDVSIGYVSLETRLPLDGVGNVIEEGSGWLVGEDDDPWVSFPPEVAFESRSEQGVERLTGGLNLRWSPTDWLSVRSNVGLDDVSTVESFFQAPNKGIEFFDILLPGTRQVDQTETRQYSVDIGLRATRSIGESVRTGTAVGAQFFRNLWHLTTALGQDLVPGGETVTFGRTTSASEETQETRTVGTYVEQQLSFGDRLFVTGSLRGDDGSALGRDFDFVLYPKVATSWELAQQEFLSGWESLTNLRLRAAWGKAGIQPGLIDALFTYQLFPVVVGGRDDLGARVGNAGDPTLEPEQSSEWEAGGDFALFGGRLGGQVTYYSKRTEDALAVRSLPPSLGVTTFRRENIGVVSNRGWELELSGTPWASGSTHLSLSANASFNRSRIEDICLEGDDGRCDASPIRVGFWNQHRIGYEPGAFWDIPVLGHDDIDGDGLIEEGEVLVGDTAVYFGSAQPTRLVNVAASLTLFDRLTLTGLVDHQGGHSQINVTGSRRCLGQACRAAIDANAPATEQLRSVAARARYESPFFEPGWFVRLRELAVSYRMPESWARGLGAEGMMLTVSGRNLARVDDYSGLDPETNSGGAANFNTADFFGFPPSRYFLARLGVTF